MTGSVSSENRAEPNLTPILDMVFQLITFFMLVINFKAASMDMNLKLPAVGLARPVEFKGISQMLLNITREGTVRAYGSDIPEADLPNFIEREAQTARLTARRTNPDFKDTDDLPAVVLIRADRKTRYRYLNNVITLCQKNGLRQFSLRAMNKVDDQ